MTANSLTRKSAKNSAVALIFYAINLLLQFVSRKIFIEYLGEDVLGLNTTISSILQFLNIAELGIGSAVGYTLYKPLHDNDQAAINEIVALQGWLYKRIAYIIIAASSVLLIFFPLIFEKTPLPLWYSYATFGALLFSSLLSYFVNYKQIVLSADQKEYKIQYSYKAAVLVKLVFQIVFIKIFDNGYIWWVVLEVLFAIVASVALSCTVKRTYPYLADSKLSGKELLARHPVVWTKTKQLFFHKIGAVALTRVSPIVIYAYATLELVAIYGNYMLIMSGVTSLITAMFNSMNAGVGNLVAGGDKDRISRVYNELFSIRFLMSVAICFCVYNLTQSFMNLWMGPDLLLDKETLLLFVLITFININRLTPDSFINAYGLFGDVAAPIIEALLNLGLSVVLGKILGINGVLLGVFLSLFFVIFIWKQYYLYKKGFQEPIFKCLKLYSGHILATVISYPIIKYLYSLLAVAEVTNFMVWILNAVIFAVISVLVLGLFLLGFTSGMKDFIRRLSRIVRNLIDSRL